MLVVEGPLRPGPDSSPRVFGRQLVALEGLVDIYVLIPAALVVINMRVSFKRHESSDRAPAWPASEACAVAGSVANTHCALDALA